MRSLAKATTRMLFAVATPMHMMAPISAGTLSVVRVTNRNSTIPASARRKRADDDERIEPRLKVHDDQQINQHDAKPSPAYRAVKDVRIVSTCPRRSFRSRAAETSG